MKKTLNNKWQLLLRASICEQKKQYASVDDIVLTLAYMAGPDKSRPIFEKSGFPVEKSRHFISSMPRLAKLDLSKDYPPAKPDDTLKKAIQTTLKPFIEGKEDVIEALKKMVPPSPSTRKWLQDLSMYFMLYWTLGHRYYGLDKMGVSKFIECETETFENCFEETHAKASRYRDALENRLWYSSPLGKIQQEYGEYAARVIAVAILAEADLVAGGFVRISELAWTYCPDGLKNWHRHLSYVCKEVEELIKSAYLETNNEEARVQSKVIVTKEFHDEFYSFIRNEDPLGDIVVETYC